MPYDENLAHKLREALMDVPNVEEKNMMGGLIYMVNGKMCMGIVKDEIMCRIDPDRYNEALARRGCREMDFTGRPMKGFVFVEYEGYKNGKDFMYWVDLSLTFNKIAKASKKKA